MSTDGTSFYFRNAVSNSLKRLFGVYSMCINSKTVCHLCFRSMDVFPGRGRGEFPILLTIVVLSTIYFMIN